MAELSPVKKERFEFVASEPFQRVVRELGRIPTIEDLMRLCPEPRDVVADVARERAVYERSSKPESSG